MSSFRRLPQSATAPMRNCLDFGWRIRRLSVVLAVIWRSSLNGSVRKSDEQTPSNPTQAYRGLIAGYTEAIRASDFKANIAFLFVAFMMGRSSRTTRPFRVTSRSNSCCCLS